MCKQWKVRPTLTQYISFEKMKYLKISSTNRLKISVEVTANSNNNKANIFFSLLARHRTDVWACLGECEKTTKIKILLHAHTDFSASWQWEWVVSHPRCDRFLLRANDLRLVSLSRRSVVVQTLLSVFTEISRIFSLDSKASQVGKEVRKKILALCLIEQRGVPWTVVRIKIDDNS